MNTKLAFLFPGQGSQAVAMLSELAQHLPLIQATYQEASQVLGYDLWNLVQQGPESRLNQTEYTQPALLAAGVALWRVWCNQGGVKPSLLAGHSLGEYTALVCAGTLKFSDATTLVALRGRLMQEAVAADAGSMAAIVGLTTEQINAICAQAAAGQIISPANFNAIGQTVLSGDKAAIDRAIKLAQAMGAKMAKQIPVSVPSHCLLMKPAADKLADYLTKVTLNNPQIVVVNNVDVACYTEPDKIRSALVRQLYNPVRWVETIQYVIKQGIQHAIECGPGKVLAGLNKRIDANLTTMSIGSLAGYNEAYHGVAVLPSI